MGGRGVSSLRRGDGERDAVRAEGGESGATGTAAEDDRSQGAAGDTRTAPRIGSFGTAGDTAHQADTQKCHTARF